MKTEVYLGSTHKRVKYKLTKMQKDTVTKAGGCQRGFQIHASQDLKRHLQSCFFFF